MRMPDADYNFRGKFGGLEDWNAEKLRDGGVGEGGGRKSEEILEVYVGGCGVKKAQCRARCVLHKWSKVEMSDNTALT